MTDYKEMVKILIHDLRSVLSEILGSIYLINHGNFNDEEKGEFLKCIEESAWSANMLIEDLPRWSRWKNNGDLEKKEINLLNILKNIINLVSLLSKRKKISIKIPENNIFILGDEIAVKLIMRNILTNALKFSSENSVVEIHYIEEADFNQIIIKDYGIGMDENTINSILKQKVCPQIDTDNKISTGIGWSLCTDLIQKMNGRIEIESEVGQGTSIKIFLPMA